MSSDKLYVATAVAVWKSAYEKADKLFSLLTEEELEKRVAPERNRLVYLWGHLTAMHDRMTVLLGLGDRLTSQFDAVFLTSPDRAVTLPPIEEMRNAWRQVSDRAERWDLHACSRRLA